MKNYFKFACVYCGQHLECAAHLQGQQIRCPACYHRVVIPVPNGSDRAGRLQPAPDWHTSVPIPRVETPTRYRGPAGRLPPARRCLFICFAVWLAAQITAAVQNHFTDETEIKKFLHDHFDGTNAGMVIGVLNEHGSRPPIIC